MDRGGQAAGRKVEILLYDCSSVFGGRGNPQTTDWQLTTFMYYMQGFIRGYDVVMNLIRFPDGVTGRNEPIYTVPKVVNIMRRLEIEGKFVGQPLLVTDEERFGVTDIQF